MKYKNTFRYALIGALFGLSFPIIATLVDRLYYNLPLTFDNLTRAQAGNPLLWIIDTAPFFLGIFAGLAGIRQDRLAHEKSKLETEILVRKQTFEELEKLRNSHDQVTKERTQALEKIVSQLRASAEIGQAITSIRDLDTLLGEAAILISERFDFYHTGIFLLDDIKEYAVLKAANSEGGQRMLARKHKFKIGDGSIVGTVTSQQKPRIAQDVGTGAVFFDNPDLPDTRSQITLPLMVGGELLGALDIQSKREAAFEKDDISVLQVLANQVAVAIDNAFLFAESQKALEASRRAYGEISQQAWNQYLSASSDIDFLATPQDEIRLHAPEWADEMAETFQVGEITQHGDKTVHIPIILRDQTLGIVRLRKREEAGPWSNDEIELMGTLVDQLENALETARLYSDTQRQAARVRLTQDVTDKLHRSLDMDSLMQTLLQEISTALGASGAFIQLSAPSTESDSASSQKISTN